MVVGVRENQVTCKELKILLNKNEDENIKLLDLLKLAFESGKITDEQLAASLPTTNSTIKCYLYSVIEDPKIRETIDKYVLISSKHYTRGSIIANLLCISKIGNPTKFDILNLQENQSLVDLYNFTENQNVIKQLFLPERWPTKDHKLDLGISEVMTSYKKYLDPHYDSSWKDLMLCTGWDNALNRTASKYRANIENHILNHLPKHLKEYCKEIVERREDVVDKKTGLYTLFSCIRLPLRPYSNIHQEDFEHIIEVRDFLKIKRKEFIPNRFSYSVNVFIMFMKLTKIGITRSNYLPVAKIGRKYCYLDSKICRYLFKDKFKLLIEENNKNLGVVKTRKSKKQSNNEENETTTKKTVYTPNISEILDITPIVFRNKRKKLRTFLRRKYKDCKKLKRKWLKLGRSNMPKNSIIASVETDGVGLSIGIQRKIKLPVNEEAVTEDIKYKVLIGIDTGRAKPATAAISTDPLKKPISVTFTRRQYYHEMKHRIRMKWENKRVKDNNLKPLLTALASNTGFENYISLIAKNYTLMENEYLIDKERALWKMRLFRLKKRSLDKAAQKIFDAAKKENIIIGFGNASFAATGKGEKAAPTTAYYKALLKAKYRYPNHVKIVNIWEYNTTKKCCCCGHTTEPGTRKDGKSSVRLRLCSNCSTESNVWKAAKAADPRASAAPQLCTKLRDRDVQAARNILWLLQHKIVGSLRPWYLCPKEDKPCY